MSNADRDSFLFTPSVLQVQSIMKIAMTSTAIVLVAVMGVTFYTSNEGWSGIQAFYWTVCTMTVSTRNPL